MKQVEVKIGRTSDNPFYGLKACLLLFQNGAKESLNPSVVDAAWKEVKDDHDKRKMFYSLLFSIGDITARQHNIFGKSKIDSGGNAARDNFRMIMIWLKKNNYMQFVKFMFAKLFNEFTSFDNLLAMRIQTKKKSKEITKKIDMVENSVDIPIFIANIIMRGNPFDKFLVSKFLSRPRLSKRSKHKIMLPETKQMMLQKQELIKIVSDIINHNYQKGLFNYEVKNKYINFIGFYNWKKQFNGELESVLFSSGKIREFDETSFKLWLDKLPASARHRVRCRVLTKENEIKSKWGEIGKWFLEWENFKDAKQKEVRTLEEKIRQQPDMDGFMEMELTDDQIKLKELKKEAKVTVGAIKFDQIFKEIIMNTADLLKIQPFLDKINLPYNNLVFVDDSGSMSYHSNSLGFSAFDFAAFMATIFMMKNPDDTGRSLLGLFSTETRMHSHIEGLKRSPNRLLNSATEKVSLPFYNPELNFKDNLYNMKAFLEANRTGSSTNIGSIPDFIHAWSKGDSSLIEQIQQFPVWTIITDGEWNSMYSPESSLNDFMRKCQLYFGFKPFIIAIDAANGTSTAIDRFSGIENFMYLPANPAQIEMFLTNFKDIDVMDIYTPLLSLFRSNRYEIVRNNTL
jgi:hypothetical protein